MGAVCGKVVWCGGMGCSAGQWPNVPVLEDIVACNSKAIITFACNGVEQHVGTTRAPVQQQANRH